MITDTWLHVKLHGPQECHETSLKLATWAGAMRKSQTKQSVLNTAEKHLTNQISRVFDGDAILAACWGPYHGGGYRKDGRAGAFYHHFHVVYRWNKMTWDWTQWRRVISFYLYWPCFNVVNFVSWDSQLVSQREKWVFREEYRAFLGVQNVATRLNAFSPNPRGDWHRGMFGGVHRSRKETDYRFSRDASWPLTAIYGSNATLSKFQEHFHDVRESNPEA